MIGKPRICEFSVLPISIFIFTLPIVVSHKVIETNIFQICMKPDRLMQYGSALQGAVLYTMSLARLRHSFFLKNK